MTKPSERIYQIARERGLSKQFPAWNDTDIILQYLDEEYEKNKPCEHKDSYTVDSTSDVYYNVCNDCGVLFLGK